MILKEAPSFRRDANDDIPPCQRHDREGDKAPAAAGVIHTDFERGFLAAETVHYDDLVALGSLVKAREAGKLRIEGKEYVVRDGDVVEFRFNV